MPNFKIVFGLKDGRSVQKEVKEPESKALLGKRIGSTVHGDDIGFPGYEFQITGGSNTAGFPMRYDVEGTTLRSIFSIQGVGVSKLGKGQRHRKTVSGNTIGAQTAQVNMKVMKEGKEPLLPPKEEKEEEKKAEGKKTE